MRKPIAVACKLIAVTLASTCFAQDKPPAVKAIPNQVGGLRFIDTSEVAIVNVEVSVTYKNAPVLGLTAADFEVFQDGKPQSITNFVFYRGAVTTPASPTPAPKGAPAALPTATPTPAPTAVPAPPRDPRFITFYVDNENIMPQNRNRVLNRVIEFVHDHLQAPDQAMVVSYQRSMKIIQPFTSDGYEVGEALRKLKKYTGARTEVVSSRRQIEDFISQNAENAETYTQALSHVESFAREQRNSLVFAVRSIQELVGMMSGLPGKKAIIYVSDGLPMTPGLELYYELQDRYRTPSAISLSRDYDSTDLYRSLVTTAAAAGVVMYAIDARGLDSELGVEAENRTARSTLAAAMAVSNYQDSLLYMAEQTGGIAIIGSNDASIGLQRIADDFETYYFLGYRLIPTGEDRAHVVNVKVKGHSEYRLSFRRKFIEKSLATRIGDRVVSGLTFDLDDNPLRIVLSSRAPTPADGGRWMLPVEIKVPIDKIALVPDGEELAGYLMVYYSARDDDGKQSDLQRQEHPIRIKQSEYESARRQNWTITASLLLEPGKYRISVGVRDELTNQAGYAAAREIVHPELVQP